MSKVKLYLMLHKFTLGNLVLTLGNCTLVKFMLDNLILILGNCTLGSFTLGNPTKGLNLGIYPG